VHHAHEAYLVPDLLKQAYGAAYLHPLGACGTSVDHVAQDTLPQLPSSQLTRGTLPFQPLSRLPSQMVSRYKREAYRGSEFAARILSENGLTVVVKVGHIPQLMPTCSIMS
jgi:hypothetical protein